MTVQTATAEMEKFDFRSAGPKEKRRIQPESTPALRIQSHLWDIVEWLVSMPAVWLFVGSAVTICFGLACWGYTFDRSAFNVGYFLKSLFWFWVHV